MMVNGQPVLSRSRPQVQVSPAYGRIERLLAEDTCVILDGGVSTELQRANLQGYQLDDEGLWGTWGLYNAPHAVLEVHRSFVAAGCDLISTDTWAILEAPEREAHGVGGATLRPHWMDVARLGVRLARQAIEEAGKSDDCAVAFTLNGDVTDPQQLDTLRLLLRVLADNPPDLIFMETMSLLRDDLTVPAVEIMLETGLPVWLSFRRCRDGVCGIHGQHWGGPEGDLFGRAARQFESLGVGALLINCLPTDHVPGMLPWLRDFTDLPLGVYPNLGRYADPGWKFDERVGPEDYADLAAAWRQEGAQIVGGCCGVSPDHLVAARQRLAGTKPGRPQPAASPWRGPTLCCPSRHARRRRGGRAVGRYAGTPTLSAAIPRDRLRRRRVPTHPGQLPTLEAPLSYSRGPGSSLPGHWLWQRHPNGPVGLERRYPRGRLRHSARGRG